MVSKNTQNNEQNNDDIDSKELNDNFDIFPDSNTSAPDTTESDMVCEWFILADLL